MKKLLLFACLLLSACSKNNDDAQNNNPNIKTVSIGGGTYNTVVVGSQTWTALNYNGAGGVNYNNGTNTTTYGKLYTVAEAKAIVVPTGWRLPTQADFDNLFVAIGANKLGNGGFSFPLGCALKLMSTSDWTNQNGTDDLKFKAEPAGCSSGASFGGQGIEAMFWSSTVDTGPVVMIVSPNQITTSSLFLPGISDRGSVRFVRDN